VLVLGIAGAVAAGEQEAAKNVNVCYTENIEVAKGGPFSVKVFVTNVDTLAGMQVPIYFRSEEVNLLCDSVTFGGSRCAHFGFSDYKIEPKGKTVYFSFIFMIDPNTEIAPLMPGDGLVATLWFTAPTDTKAGTVTLESGPNAFLPNPKIDYGYHFWTPAALEVDCLYKPGTIKVK
jgi:hypothetical protein